MPSSARLDAGSFNEFVIRYSNALQRKMIDIVEHYSICVGIGVNRHKDLLNI
jgi:hypothetical protein